MANESHPLLSGTQEVIPNWQTFLKLWESAPNLEARHSLLYVGFKVPYQGEGYDYPVADTFEDRFCFYLDIANGYKHLDLFSTEQGDLAYYNRKVGPFGNHSRPEILQAIATRAFKTVALEFFDCKNENLYDRNRLWELCKPGVLEKIVWFFRIEQRPDCNYFLPNLWVWADDDLGHVEVKACDFLRKLCHAAFTDSGNRGRYALELSGQLKAVRPWAASILALLGDTSILLHEKVAPLLDEDCLVALKEIALGSSYHFPGKSGSRHPASVTEACYAGSLAAQTLILIEVIRAEAEKFETQASLRRRQVELQNELARHGMAS